MKKYLVFVTMSLVLFFGGIALAGTDDPLGAGPWYFQLSGGAKGAMKLVFSDDTFHGTGASVYSGVFQISGDYIFDGSTNTCSGNYTIDGDFNYESGTFSGKLNKKGDKLTVKIVSEDYVKCTAKGSLGAPNIMISTPFNISMKGDDRGTFYISPYDSGYDDIFYFSGDGSSVYNGATSLEMSGYCDGKGTMYGSWYAYGEYYESEGTFSGTYKKGKLKAKCMSIYGDVFNIKSY